MDKPQIVHYTDTHIFGANFGKVARGSPDIISKLFFEGVVMLNGKVDLQVAAHVDKIWLWRYLRYLWFHNHNTTNPDLKQELPSTLDAQSLVNLVSVNTTYNTAADITKEQIAQRINTLIERHAQHMQIPALSVIANNMKARLADTLTSAQVASNKVEQAGQSLSVPVSVNYYKNTDETGLPIVQGQTQQTLPITLKNGALTISVKIAGKPTKKRKSVRFETR